MKLALPTNADIYSGSKQNSPAMFETVTMMYPGHTNLPQSWHKQDTVIFNK